MSSTAFRLEIQNHWLSLPRSVAPSHQYLSSRPCRYTFKNASCCAVWSCSRAPPGSWSWQNLLLSSQVVAELALKKTQPMLARLASTQLSGQDSSSPLPAPAVRITRDSSQRIIVLQLIRCLQKVSEDKVKGAFNYYISVFEGGGTLC